MSAYKEYTVWNNHLATVSLMKELVHAPRASHFPQHKVVIGGCARNVHKHLPKVFRNIAKIANLFADYHIIVYHDIADEEKTLQFLRDYERASVGHMTVIDNPITVSEYRTHRLAYGRNQVVEMIEEKFADFDYLINLDLDYVSEQPANTTNLVQAIEQGCLYDVITFNRRGGYYDQWALRFDTYQINPFDFPKKKRFEILGEEEEAINAKLSRLSQDQFLEVESAFNGIAVYSIPTVVECRYSGLNEHYSVSGELDWPEECEHVNFHRELRLNKGAKIVVSPRCVF